MKAKRNIKCIAILALLLITTSTPALSAGCGSSVKDIFTVTETPIVGRIAIEGMDEQFLENFTGYVIDGPIPIVEYERPGDPPYCEGETSWWYNIESPNRRFVENQKVYHVVLTIVLPQIFLGYNIYKPEDGCQYKFEERTSYASFYTPVDNPHPIYEYLKNRYPFDDPLACIGPKPHKEGQPPDTKDDSQLGKDPANDEPDTKGDPISIYNGNNVHAETDLTLPSPFSGGLQIKRYYNSRLEQSDLKKFHESVKSTGYGWTHNFNVDISYLNFWSLKSHAPLGGCDPDYFNGYITFRWWQVLDGTGRKIFFFQHPCNYDYVGIRGEKSYLTGTEPPGYWPEELTWHNIDGFKYFFKEFHLLSEITDPNGNRQTMTYTPAGLLETVTDEATGQVLTFHYDAQSLLEQISGPVTTAVPDGVWVRYGHDAEQNLTSVTYPDGSGYIYDYNDPNDAHNLTAKKDQDGNFIFGWEYDNQDRGIVSTTNGDNGVTINYVDDDATVEVTNAYGVTHTHTLTTIDGKRHITAISGPADCPNCGEQTVRYAHHADGRVAEVEYVNGRIDRREEYDARGNLLTEILDAGGTGQVTLHYVYHPSLNKPLSRIQTSVLGQGDKQTIWDYDDDGNATPNENPGNLVHRLIERGFTLDENGDVAPFEHVTLMSYNARGQVIAVNGPRPGDEDTITFSYDPNTGNLDSVTKPLEGTTIFAAYDAAGNPTRIIDPNGIEATLTYDGRNRVLTVTRNGHTTSTVYTHAGKPDTITDAAGRVIDFQYNTKNFLERIIDPAGNYQELTYTQLGNREIEAIYTAAGVPTKTMRYEYGDPLNTPNLEAGKPWKAIRRNHDNTADLATVFAYDAMGNPASVTDAADNTTIYQYDAFERLVCTEQPGQTVTEYEYDTQGNLIAVTDPEGLLTQYLYDDLGRLVKTDSPDTGETFYLYDQAGNLIRKNDNGRVTAYTYDAANRQTLIAYADDTTPVMFTYDTGTGNYLAGRLASVTDASGERHFSYDSNGYIETETSVRNGVAYVTDYDFDPAGNLRTMVYPTGQTIHYLPDAVDPGLTSAVRLGANQTLAGNVTYNPFGPVAGMNLGNTIQVAKAYDLNYQPSAITAGSVQNLTFTPDNTGNITTIADNLNPSRSQTFGYDPLNRLTSAAGPYGAIGFAYDKTGNRLTRTLDGATDTYTYVPGTNLLNTSTGSRTVNFDHDPQGNMIGRTFVTGSAPANTQMPDYTYTHDGQRSAKTVEGQTTVYHYDIAGQLIAETDVTGALKKAYVWFQGQPLAMIAADGAVYYYHNDHLGTPQRLTDSTLTVVWAADYLPFGQADVKVATVENNLRFTGQYYDVETGLHYNYWRFYDPGLGRYLRADPIGLAGGINPFAYVQNNPVNGIDPYGLIIGSALSKVFGRLVGATAQEAALSGKVADSVIGAVIGVNGGLIPPSAHPYVHGAALGLQIWGTIQTVSLASLSVGASSVAAPLGLSGLAGFEIGSLINKIPIGNQDFETWLSDVIWNALHGEDQLPCN